MQPLKVDRHIESCEHGPECETCCWQWTAALSRNGYGRAKVTCFGKLETYAHRIVWSQRRKRRIPVGKVVGHTCDNKACCNPAHLMLMGPRQYHAKMQRARHEMRRDGIRFGNVKLTNEQVLMVVEQSGEKTQTELAKEFGVTQVSISNILSGRTWGHLTGKKRSHTAKHWVRSNT